jgi:hypothetical protein
MLLFFFIKITTIKRTVRNYCFQPFFYGMPSTEGRLAYESGKYCTVCSRGFRFLGIFWFLNF